MVEETQTKMIYAKLQRKRLEKAAGAQICAFVQSKVLVYLFDITLRTKDNLTYTIVLHAVTNVQKCT